MAITFFHVTKRRKKGNTVMRYEMQIHCENAKKKNRLHIENHVIEKKRERSIDYVVERALASHYHRPWVGHQSM
jgi:hypothetical protein